MKSILIFFTTILLITSTYADIVSPQSDFRQGNKSKYNQLKVSGTEAFSQYYWDLKIYHKDELIAYRSIIKDPDFIQITFKDRFVRGELVATSTFKNTPTETYVFDISPLGEEIIIKNIRNNQIKVRKKELKQTQSTVPIPNSDHKGPLLPMLIISTISLLTILYIQFRKRSLVYV